MVEYFKPNQVLILPELAGRLQLKTEKFFVRQKFDGGMGTCYRIEDEQNRSYALKIIHQNLLIDENNGLLSTSNIKHIMSFYNQDMNSGTESPVYTYFACTYIGTTVS